MNTTAPYTKLEPELKAQLREALLQYHGPVMGGESLAAALGHRSMASLRQARHRQQISIHLFRLPHRRGWFALTQDVADWLADRRMTATTHNGSSNDH